MPDELSDIVLQIKTILESQGIDAANKALDGFIAKSSDATGQSSSQTTQLRDLQRGLQGANIGVHAFTAALQGNIQGLAQAGQATKALGGSFAQFGVVAGAFGAGWGLGTAIFKNIVSPLMDAHNKAQQTTKSIQGLRDELVQLGKTRLDALKTELDDLAKRVDAMSTKGDDARRRAAAERAAATQQRIAAIEAGPMADPEKMRAIAAEREKAAQDDLAAAQEEVADRKAAVEEFKQARTAKIAELEKRITDTVAAAEAVIAKGPQASREETAQARLERENAPKMLAQGRAALDEQQALLDRDYQDALSRARVAQTQAGTAAIETGGTGTRAAEMESKAAAEAKKERELAKVEAEKEKQKGGFEAHRAAIEADLETAAPEADRARRAAERYAPAKGARGGALRQQQVRDADLEVAAMAAEAREAKLKAALKALEDQNAKMVAAFQQHAKTIREQNKNLPL